MRFQRKRISDRSGFTLVHAVVLIGMLPLMLIAATKWVHESMKMSSRFQQRRETNVVLNHFSNEFQDDVRACKSLNFDADSNQIELTGHENQKIVYEIEDGQIQKTSTVGGEVVGRNNFRLSDEYFAEWDAEAGTDRAALKVFRYPTPLHDSVPETLQAPDAKVELVITAKANRWRQTVTFGRGIGTGGDE